MAIIKSNSNALKLQIKSRFPVDRVSKSILCIPYAIDVDAVTPSPGRLSFFPRAKPIEVTSIRISTTTILGNDLTTFFEYSTEGGLVVSYRDQAEYFSAFKITSIDIVDNGKAVQYGIGDILNSDGVSFFPLGQQVCISPLPAPTSEALKVIDGGYY